DQQLVVASAVEVAGVEQRDPALERRVDRRDTLGLVGGAVHARHAHATQCEPGHLGPGAKSYCLHRHGVTMTPACHYASAATVGRRAAFGDEQPFTTVRVRPG